MLPTLKLEGDCWPTEEQSWLLRAALLPGEAGLQAWQTWRPALARPGLDAGSARLLPLLYSNLRRLGVTGDAPPLLKEQYRRTWLNTQRRMGSAANVLASLHAAGVETLVLKGLALALLYYENTAARPMSDFDVAVRSQDAPRALQALAQAGWSSFDGRGLALQGDIEQSGHMQHESGRGFDFHWHLLWECCYDEADELLRQDAVPLKVNEVETRTLAPAAQLTHVCVHGARWNEVPPLRWAADAMQILRHTGDGFDWPRLLLLARQLRLSLPLADTLGYLRAMLDAPIPPEVLEELRAMPVSANDRAFYRLRTRPKGRLGGLPMVRHHYQSLAEARQQKATLGGFVDYVRRSWGLESAWQMPADIVRRAAGKLSEGQDSKDLFTTGQFYE